jgi:hypothetical protein
MKAALLGAALLAFALCAGRASGATATISPRTGTLAATPFTVNNGFGDQTDPHVSGRFVTYTNEVSGNSDVQLYDMPLGTTVSIPNGGSLDFLSDTSGGRVTYTHLGDDSSVWTYDAANGASSEVDPTPSSNRRESRIGGATIAWQDFGYTNDITTPEIVAYDTATGTETRLTNDLMLDKDPAVSPDGNTIVWTKCRPDGTSCTIWEAHRDGSGWTTAALTSAADGDARLPDTDGRVVVYSVVTPSGDEDVEWQPVGGGQVRELALPGEQTNPNISNGVITFEQLDMTTQVPNYDVWLYRIATNTVYRLTDTPEDETLNDVDVSPEGTVTVVWTKSEADDNVYGEWFSLPPVASTLTLTPGDGSQDVGTKGAVTATVEDGSGSPLAGADVRFSVSGAISQTGSCTTAADGTCSFDYDGPATAGAVDVSAFVDTDEDGAPSDGEPTASATRDFVALSDTTPPTVSVDGFDDGQLVLLGAQRPVATCSSSDDGSGLASTTGPTEQDDLTANGVGTVSVTCTATDRAGNTASATKSYRVGYAFGGFLAPVQGAPAVNAGHAGRAYPLQWQLADANGAAISALSAVATIRYSPVACDGFTGDENAVDADSTGNAGLRYDAAAAQFVYTWKTPRASGCYTLSVTLDSGQSFDAYFRLS